MHENIELGERSIGQKNINTQIGKQRVQYNFSLLHITLYTEVHISTYYLNIFIQASYAHTDRQTLSEKPNAFRLALSNHFCFAILGRTPKTQ